MEQTRELKVRRKPAGDGGGSAGRAGFAGGGEQRLGGLMKELRNVARPCPLIREDKGCYNSRRRPRES